MKDNTLHAAQLAEVVRWTGMIRETQCASFVDVALRHPDAWSALRMNGAARRMVAQAMGWSIRIETAVIQDRSLAELGAVLLNSGVEDAIKLWRKSPDLCNALHQANKLESLVGFLHASVVSDSSRDVADADDQFQVCGYLQAWLRLNPESASDALQSGRLDAVIEALPVMPSGGWMTAGGPVFDLPELILGRALESANVAFFAPGATSSAEGDAPLRDAFWLPQHQLAVRVCSASDYRSRLSGIASSCVVLLDSSLIDSEGSIIAFSQHIIVSLSDAGIAIRLPNTVTYASLLQPGTGRSHC